MRTNSKRWRLVAAAGLATAVLAVGCGSDDDDGGSTGASAPSTSASETTGGGAAPTGDPLKVFVIVPIDTPAYSLDHAVAGAKAAARAINADGGIQGRPVEVELCNTRVDPNQEVSCARKAVSDGAIATVNSYPVANGAGFQQVLTDNHISDIASSGTAPEAFRGDNVFPIDFPPGNYAMCTSRGFVEESGAGPLGSTTVDVPVAAQYTKVVTESAKNQGTEYVGDVKMAVQNADATALVQQLSNKGAEAAILVLAQTQVPPFVTAAAGVGKEWPYCASPTITGGATMLQLGDTAQNYWQGSTLPPLTATDEIPQMDVFIADMAAEEEAGDRFASTAPDVFNLHALRAWTGLQIINDVASRMDGDITAETFMDALSRSTVDVGIVPPLDFTRPMRADIYERVFNPTITLQKWDPDEKTWTLYADRSINALEAIYGTSG